MLRISRLLALPIIAGGLIMLAGASEAQAQVRVQIGGFGFNSGGYRGGAVHRGGHTFHPNHNYNRSAYRGRHGGHGYIAPRIHVYGHGGHHGIHHGGYHDTSHYDYHPPEIYRHGNHFDIQPGHYDFHRSGHYHHW